MHRKQASLAGDEGEAGEAGCNPHMLFADERRVSAALAVAA